MKIWNCEHCGKDTRDAERSCDYCECGMCLECTIEHDDNEICPSTAPVGTRAAAMRDRMEKIRQDSKKVTEEIIKASNSTIEKYLFNTVLYKNK